MRKSVNDQEFCRSDSPEQAVATSRRTLRATGFIATADVVRDYLPSSYPPPWSWEDEARWVEEDERTPGIEAYIAEHGIDEPILLDEEFKRVLDGHHRIIIALKRGINRLPKCEWPL